MLPSAIVSSLMDASRLAQSHFSWLLTGLVAVVPLVVVARMRRRHRRRNHLRLHFERASRFDAKTIPRAVDTVVIGSGPGGCACANLLAQQGQRVLVLEQHPTNTGGGTHSFRIEGCEWDTGLHYSSAAMAQPTTRPGALMDYMSMGMQHFRQFPEPYDEIVFKDGKSYGYLNGRESTLESLLSSITDEELRRRVRVYMDLYHEIHQGFVALGLSKILPWWLQFLVQGKVDLLRQYASLTVKDVQYAVLNKGLSKGELLSQTSLAHTEPANASSDSEEMLRLKAVLAHPIGDYGVQPRDASFAAHGVTAEHYIEGGSYTIGPTQNISTNLLSVVRAYGGDVFVDATIRSIMIQNGKAAGVRVSSTTDLKELGNAHAPVVEIRARNVVAATSVYNTYTRLLPQELEAVRQFRDPAQRTIRQSNGHNFVFCKLAGGPDELDLPDHNLWYFANDLDQAYNEFFANPLQNRPPVVYIGFPCTKDPTWKKRFPGVSNCIVISDSLYKWFEKWADMPVKQRGAEYEALKQELAKSLLDILYECVPQIKGKIVYHHLATPLTEESWLGSYRGGAYDTLCTPDMFAAANQKWITPRTQIPGLFLAGSSAFFPGLTGAMYGGSLAACNVLGTTGTMTLAVDVIGNLVKRLRDENRNLSWWQAVRIAVQKFIYE